MKKKFEFSAIIYNADIPEALSILNELRKKNEINILFTEDFDKDRYFYAHGPELDDLDDTDIVYAFKKWGMHCTRHRHTILITNNITVNHDNCPSFNWFYSSLNHLWGHASAIWEYPEEFCEKLETVRGHGAYYIMMPRWEWRYHLDKDLLLHQTKGLNNAESI